MAVEKKEVKCIADLTEKCQAAIHWMRANDNGETGYFGSELAENLGFNPAGIHGVMNVLVKYGLVEKGTREASYTSKDGKLSGTKPYTTYYISDLGRTFPEA